MIKTLRITSIVTAILAVCFVALSVAFGVQPDPEMAEFLKAPGAVERFKANLGDETEKQPQLSPLVKQAQAFAAIINPPAKPKTPGELAPPSAVGPGPERPKPVEVTAKFELIGTCFYDSYPHRSLALIDEPGKGLYWVKQSGKVGHLIIEQIKDGSLICRDDQRTEELFAKRPEKKSLLKADISPEKPGESPPPREPRTAHRPVRRDAGRRRTRRQPVSPQTEKNIEWLKKAVEEPESMGISPEEANSLSELGEIIKELEQRTDHSRTTPDSPESGP